MSYQDKIALSVIIEITETKIKHMFLKRIRRIQHLLKNVKNIG